MVYNWADTQHLRDVRSVLFLGPRNSASLAAAAGVSEGSATQPALFLII